MEAIPMSYECFVAVKRAFQDGFDWALHPKLGAEFRTLADIANENLSQRNVNKDFAPVQTTNGYLVFVIVNDSNCIDERAKNRNPSAGIFAYVSKQPDQATVKLLRQELRAFNLPVVRGESEDLVIALPTLPESAQTEWDRLRQELERLTAEKAQHLAKISKYKRELSDLKQQLTEKDQQGTKIAQYKTEPFDLTPKLAQVTAEKGKMQRCVWIMVAGMQISAVLLISCLVLLPDFCIPTMAGVATALIAGSAYIRFVFMPLPKGRGVKDCHRPSG